MDIYTLFLLYIIYSFFGWSLEVIDKYIELKRFVNRGFLIGPLCPIYGFGAVSVILLLTRYKSDPVILFVMTIVMFSILEYLTSYFMEKLFKTRWWDYSRKKFNLNGRICLETMIPFGILGLILIYIINPFVLELLLKIPNNVRMYLSIFIFIIFIVDNIISFRVVNKVKDIHGDVCKDSTEDINKKIKDYLAKGKFLDRRLVRAFPNMSIIEYSKAKRKELREKFKESRKEFISKEQEIIALTKNRNKQIRK